MITEQQYIDFDGAGGTTCLRCGRPCKIAATAHSHARMLKRSTTAKALCINCAVHNHLRHLYPANLILARSGPQGLLLPHIQQQFFKICQLAGTDAEFEEIDWQDIVTNWELPFPAKLKRTATNPVTEQELSMAKLEGQQRRDGAWKEPPDHEQRATSDERRVTDDESEVTP